MLYEADPDAIKQDSELWLEKTLAHRSSPGRCLGICLPAFGYFPRLSHSFCESYYEVTAFVVSCLDRPCKPEVIFIQYMAHTVTTQGRDQRSSVRN
jgi:hypothetical protein